jgi:hypothetical protein
MSEWITHYTVRLENGRIAYMGENECYECGWVSNDETFFYERDGRKYCSLHIDKEAK